VLELLWWLSIAYGTVRGTTLGHRPALVVGCTCIYLGVADVAGILASDFSALTPWHLFIFMFLGPSMWHLRAASGLPLPLVLTEYPVALRILRLTLTTLVACHYMNRRAKQHPLLESTFRMEQVYMPFVAAGVIDALELVLIATGYVLMRGDP
jgi:hypothetical protein